MQETQAAWRSPWIHANIEFFTSKIKISTPIFAGDDVGNLDGTHPVAGDYVPLTCWNFTIGDWKHREFYSPQYPDNYSNSTECMQLLVGKYTEICPSDKLGSVLIFALELLKFKI